MRVQTGSVSVSTEQIDTDSQTEAISAPVEQTSSDRIESAQEAPNRWVAIVDHGKQAFDDAGTEACERADHEGQLAEQDLDHAQQTARAAWAAGNYLGAAKAWGEGLTKSLAHRAEQAADLQGAIGASVVSGVADAAEGKKDAMQKVGVGVAVIAALPTGGASLSIVGAVSAGVTGYEVTQNVGELVRAENGTEAAKAALKLGVSAVMAGAEHSVKDVVEPVLERGVAKLGEKAAEKLLVSTGSVEGAIKTLEVGEKAAKFTAEVAGMSFEKFAHHSADQIVDRAFDQFAPTRAKD